MKKILITGGTGLVGTRLSELLSEKGYEVLHLGHKKSRKTAKYPTFHWDINKGTLPPEAIKGCDYIIHLAGANLFDKRWTPERKRVILESRTKGAQLLIEKLEELKHPLKAFISASAIGFYGNRGGSILTEEDEPGKDFLSDVCRQWEGSVRPVARLGIRLVILRTGIVLSIKGGALAQLEKPFTFGIGGYMGNGQEYYSWIHIDDLCRMYIRGIEDDSMEGVFNAAAPNPVRNKELITTLAMVRHKHASIISVPAPILKIALGEVSTAILDSIRVSTEKIESKGFQFEYPWIEDALMDLFKRKV